MADAITAAADLLRLIPVKVRQGLYGGFALVILIDGWWDLLPDAFAGKIAATFAGLTMILALVNTKPPPPAFSAPDVPFDAPGPFDGPPVPPAFPDEFA